MTFNNSLKNIVDMPVFEWCRFNPVSTVAGVAAISDWPNTLVGGTSRFIYICNPSGAAGSSPAGIAAGISALRYDTVSDSFNQIATPPGTTANQYNASLSYNPAHGYFGRAIGPGPGLNTIQMAGINGSALVGFKIYIYAGTGAGQERTITSVADPVIGDSGLITATSSANTTPGTITDGTTGMTVKS